MSEAHIPLLSKLAVDVVSTLMYYDIFHYPLTLTEIYHCSKLKNITQEEVLHAVQWLCEQKMIYKIGEFYLFTDDENYVIQRKKNNAQAEKVMPIAFKMAKLIAFFPYTRAIMISGGLSKNVFPEDGDIDFFIITKPQRLWLSRTLLVAFRKLFLFNSHKYFCVNYFIDEENMTIDNHNLFTATELAYLLPVYGKQLYEPFMQKNEWVKEYFPYFPLRDTTKVPDLKYSWFKRIIEAIFNTKLGEYLDEWCMNLTLKYRQKKFGHFSKQDFEVALKARKYVAKHHPNHFQKRVFDALAQRKQAFEEKFQVKLDISKS
ncbi:MAG: nucleotidyltransferase domain-containing protein [Bacteroidia bacterium]